MRDLQEIILSKLIHCDSDTRKDIIPYLLEYPFEKYNKIVFDGIVGLHDQGVDRIDQTTIYYYLENKQKLDLDFVKHLGLLNTQGLDYTDLFSCVGSLLDGHYKKKLTNTISKSLILRK